MPIQTNIHWHPEVELIYVKQGQYEIYSEAGPCLLDKGEIYPVLPNEAHSIRSVSERGLYSVAAFSLDMISMSEGHFFQEQFVKPLRFGRLTLPRKITPELPCYETVRDRVRVIISNMGNREKFQAIMDLCLAVMPFCAMGEDHTPLSKGHSAVQTCISYMYAHYAEKITLQALADLVHVHPNYLCELFKRHAGRTVFEYLTRIRLDEACNLLYKPSVSIGQVAELCGFNSLSYFERKFKATYGITPKGFHNAYTKK